MSLNTKVINMSIVNLLILNNFSLCFMGLRPIFREIAILESMVQNSTVSFPWINTQLWSYDDVVNMFLVCIELKKHLRTLPEHSGQTPKFLWLI